MASRFNRLRKEGVLLPGLSQQIDLIKEFRNRAVHGGTSFPTSEQAEAIVLLVRDAMKQVVALDLDGG